MGAPEQRRQIITKRRPDFDSSNYGYDKLSDLMTATTLFDLDRRVPGDGKPAVIYTRDKRHADLPKSPTTSFCLLGPGHYRKDTQLGKQTLNLPAQPTLVRTQQPPHHQERPVDPG